MKPSARVYIGFVAFCLVLVSCEPPQEEQISAINTYLKLPDQRYAYDGLIDDKFIELGRVFFYDKHLSANNTISCASCHKQAYAFGDNVAFSKGFKGGLALRNTMQLTDARFSSMVKTSGGPIRPGGLFWDGRAASMFDAVIQPITNHIEMGMPDMETLAEKLNGVAYYKELFARSFDEYQKEIGPADVQMCLTFFVMAMNSRSSRFQQSEKGIVQMTASEELGKKLFIEKYECASCHEGQLGVHQPMSYTNTAGFANIGLPDATDRGLYEVTKRPEDMGLFRIPNLNNVAITAPYMHDGSLATLEDVLDHYSGSIQAHPNLDKRLRNADGSPLVMDIGDDEKKAIIDFLKMFTDEELINDPRFSNPFKRAAQ